MHDFDHEIDVTGSSCPIPLIELAKAVNKMQSGQILKINGDDPIFEKGVRDYCEVQQLEVLDILNQPDRKVSIFIKC